MAFYDTVRLEKGMYNTPGKALQVLEELDPSASYENTEHAGLDNLSAPAEAVRH